MNSRTLGRSDVRVSEIALGTWGLAAGAYGTVSTPQFERTVTRAIELGLTTFDCAPTWGEDGASERIVARAVGDRRKGVVYVTRGGAALEGAKVVRRFDADALVQDCEASLKRLATDAV